MVSASSGAPRASGSGAMGAWRSDWLQPGATPWALGLLCALGLVGVLAAQPYGPGYYGRPYPGQPGYAPPQGQYPAPQGQYPYQPSPQGRYPYAPYQAAPQPQAAPPQTQDPRFRPVPPSNAQGAPPSYQPGAGPRQTPRQMPYQTPGYPSGWPQPYAPGQGQIRQARPPELEWRLEEPDPYLQQPVVLELEVVSSENLSSANLELPATADALIQKMEGPETSTRSRDGRREIVNRFRLTLVPLRTGSLELPPIKVTGKLDAGGRFGQSYVAEMERPVRLQVRPPMTSVRPWLPLKSLSLKSMLDREGALEPGQPVTLALEISAVGATAVQLPTLESQLSGPGFRAYREQTLTDTSLSADGHQVMARRTEYYTLVPQAGGRLSLPEMSIAWWNVDLGVREVARLPIKTLEVRGGGPFGLSASALSGSEWAKIWIPLAGVLLLVGGYWVGVLYRGRPFAAAGGLLSLPWRGARWSLGFVAARAGPHLAHLRPAALLAQMRRLGWRLMPASSHFLRCAQRANRAASAAEWCQLFEDEARACLYQKGELTQPSLTQHILRMRPGADPLVLSRLMGELDAARYGRQSLDFRRWKRELRHEIRRGRGFGRAAGDERRIRWAGLPALNPG